MVSVKRLSKFLKAGELQEAAVIYEAEVNSLPVVEMKDGEFRWSQEASRPTLEGIELTVGPNDLVAILGRVGSGKVSPSNRTFRLF
jgi:ABC-type transport system involved in cytochrome bd biosynthesis fused ATPase/permease subunit